MKKLYDDLWQTSLDSPFAGVNTHAYFLQCDETGVLIYNTSNVEDLEHISSLGGICFQYLSHRHEAGTSLPAIKSKFNSDLCASSLEQPHINTAVDVIFIERQFHSTAIEIIPTPGHTDGGLCFYYESPAGLNYLFTGDTFFQSNGRWDTLVFPKDGGSTQLLKSSLAELRSLEPDVVCSSAHVGNVAVVKVTKQEWHDAIDSTVNQL